MPKEISDENLALKKTVGDESIVPNEIGDGSIVPKRISDESLVL